MLLTITQAHVDKAYVDERTKTLSQACPIWQALNEMGFSRVSVGYAEEHYQIRDMDSNKLLARFGREHPLFDLADWFDSPCSRGTVKLDSPISADLEMFA